MVTPTGPQRAGALPTGTLTFLFSDIQGSTKLVNALGPAFVPLLERHHALMRAAFQAAGGVEVATEGDSFFVVFASAPAAVGAAAAAQRALDAEPWPPAAGPVRVRMGLHTGEGALGGDNYVGLDVHRAARIAAAAHGGQVLVSDATRALVQGALASDVTLRDLGEYRLKDLERPERLLQLVVRGLPDDFPPPRTLETPSNLPPQMTSFVGRGPEVDAASDLVRHSRLVTLTGPGGTGKTRLSLRVAEGLREEFTGGVFFVDLSPINDPDLIATTIANVVGVREEASRPVVESLEAYLRDLRLLLVLDNFEQVLGGAPLVGRLLQAAPSLTVLATSREILRLRGEQEYSVPPLGTPDLTQLPPLATLSQYDAVALFISRARAVRPEFTIDNENAPAVAAICARLDGLPLAIELAAARVKLLAPEALLSRLDKRLGLLTSSTRDLPERQRTLRGAIDWSFDLLDPTERTLFSRLGIFVGGCSIDDAQAVTDPGGELGVDMLDALASLIDKSLLRQASGSDGEPRFRMLESIREYALEHLSQGDDGAAVRRRHQDHFAALATRAEIQLLGPRQKQWLDRLENERDNLRAAIQNAAEDGRVDLALRTGASLWRFWQQRAHLAEGRATLEGLLGLPAASPRTPGRAAALGALGGVIYWQGDFAAARRAYGEALEIERTLDDPRGLAEALYNAGYAAAVSGEYAGARTMYEESLAMYARMGDRAGVPRVREALVVSMFRQGEYAAARPLQEENLRAFREAGETFRIANGLSLLSNLQMKMRDFQASRANQREALGIFRGAGDTHGVVRVLIAAAARAVAEGQLETAAQLSGAADILREPLGEILTPLTILGIEDPAQAARAAMGDKAFERAYSEGRALTLDEVTGLFQA